MLSYEKKGERHAVQSLMVCGNVILFMCISGPADDPPEPQRLDSGLGPRETSRYADKGESGSGADGGESGMSGVCLRKFWCAKTSARTMRFNVGHRFNRS